VKKQIGVGFACLESKRIGNFACEVFASGRELNDIKQKFTKADWSTGSVVLLALGMLI
jgi:hypothetical protein